MELQTVSYQRKVDYRVPAEQALQLRAQGLSLAEIRTQLGVDASLATVSRAITRARKAAQDANTSVNA